MASNESGHAHHQTIKTIPSAVAMALPFCACVDCSGIGLILVFDYELWTRALHALLWMLGATMKADADRSLE